MKLLIISHTEHYQNDQGQLLSWGATVTEINHLMRVFESITVIGMYYNQKPPQSAMPYTSDHIHFVPIPVMGGHDMKAKLGVIKNIPYVIRVVRQELKKVDCFQLRAPTGIGVFLIPYLTFFSKKKGWFKYAGNWNQAQPPLGYRIQRSLLKKQKRTVTINGKWPTQPSQCLTFENPTLFQEDVLKGRTLIQTKDYTQKLNFCFVGRLEKPKGVERILKAFSQVQHNRLGVLHFVGDGAERAIFEKQAEDCAIEVKFHGGLSRQEVFAVYEQCHVFLLPSTASEGFPKVIAEAMCFGCIPMVSDVSSITQYIKHQQNGWVISPVTIEQLIDQIEQVLRLDKKEMQNLLKGNENTIDKFTFDYYNQRIQNQIIPLFHS